MRARYSWAIAWLVLAVGAACPLQLRAQWAPNAPPPVGDARVAIEGLAGELASLGGALPGTSEHRLTLLGRAAALRLALGDTVGALAIGVQAPPRVLVGAQRDPICTLVQRGDVDGAIRYAERFAPRARRDAAVSWLAWALARGYYAPDSVPVGVLAARRTRALELAGGIGDPLQRVGAFVRVGIGAFGAHDTVVVREARHQARRALAGVVDTASRASGARMIAWLLEVSSPAEEAAWRREAGLPAPLPALPADSAAPPIAATAHDSAVGRARAGDLAGALRVAARVRDRYGFGVRGVTLLEVATHAQWQADHSRGRDSAALRQTTGRILRMAAREAATGRDSATRDDLLRRVADAQVAGDHFADALATVGRIRDWQVRGEVGSRAQALSPTSTADRADSVYRIFLAGLTDARSRDVLRLGRLRALQHAYREYPFANAAAIIDSMESAEMRTVGALVRFELAPRKPGNADAPLAALLALRDPQVWRLAPLGFLARDLYLPSLVAWVRAAPDADERRARALAVAEAVGEARRWNVGRPAAISCMR